MAVSARDVAAALRERLPGLGTVKLHKLLYYCQGHHLATFGEPLFSDTISAWDMGPVVGTLWREEKDGRPPEALPGELGEAELNTVGYVVSRYGRMTGRELEILTHGEAPWLRADRDRRPGASTRIELPWIEEYFRAADAADRSEEMPLDSEALSRFLAGARERRPEPGQADDLQEIQRRLAELRARMGADA
jgi:uncharacterized phage-associated protein